MGEGDGVEKGRQKYYLYGTKLAPGDHNGSRAGGGYEITASKNR